MDLIVPPLEEETYPTLGGQVGKFLEERAVFGPGSLKGEPLVLSEDSWFCLYRAYEVWPKGHPREGRRRFDRVAWSIRKGAAKTELMALVTFAELHPDSPVRFNGFNKDGSLRQGRPVRAANSGPEASMIALQRSSNFFMSQPSPACRWM